MSQKSAEPKKERDAREVKDTDQFECVFMTIGGRKELAVKDTYTLWKERMGIANDCLMRNFFIAVTCHGKLYQFCSDESRCSITSLRYSDRKVLF